ncbi:MAG: hypothetical protein NXI22_15635 [bacterium]|nr:hypothetical protein [bacterium]
MWCGGCQQDVPGIAPDGEDTTICCARCNQPLNTQRVSQSNQRGANCGDSCLSIEDWPFDEQLLTIERSLRALDFLPICRDQNAAEPQNVRDRTDQPERQSRKAANDKPTQPVRFSAAKTALYAGIVLVLIGGGVLAADQFVLGRELPWEVGLLAIVGGQASAIIGFALGGNSDGGDPSRSTSKAKSNAEIEPDDLASQSAVNPVDAQQAFADWRQRTELPWHKKPSELNESLGGV